MHLMSVIIVIFLGIGFLLSVYAEFLIIFRVLCSIILAMMGIQIVLNYKKTINNNDKLLKTGVFSGFTAGFFAVTANRSTPNFLATS